MFIVIDQKFSTIFIRTLFFFPVILFSIYSFFILFYFSKVSSIFMMRKVCQIYIFILLIELYWIMLLLSACMRRWWIYRPFLLEFHFDLLIWNKVISWNLFTDCHIINDSPFGSKHIDIFLNWNHFIITSKILFCTREFMISFCQMIFGNIVFNTLSPTSFSDRHFHELILCLYYF